MLYIDRFDKKIYIIKINLIICKQNFVLFSNFQPISKRQMFGKWRKVVVQFTRSTNFGSCWPRSLKSNKIPGCVFTHTTISITILLLSVPQEIHIFFHLQNQPSKKKRPESKCLEFIWWLIKELFWLHSVFQPLNLLLNCDVIWRFCGCGWLTWSLFYTEKRPIFWSSILVFFCFILCGKLNSWVSF